jgi:Ca2+-binding RTX toxin-like protein
VVVAKNVAPTISGLVTGQAGLDFFSTHPFATATISDALPGVQDSLTIVLDGSNGFATDANGALSGAGLTKIGVGTYTLAAASPAALTAELQALVFTPTRGEVWPGQTVTTNFKLTASQTANGSTLTTTATASAIETGLSYTYGGNNNMFAWGNCGGYSAIILGNGNDWVTISGQDNVVGLGSGNDVVFGGSWVGGDFVSLGGGSDNVAIFGTGDTVEAGNGKDTVVIGFTAGHDTVVLGNGNDIVSVGGTGDTVILGNGNNWVGGTQGMAFIATGSGNDVIAVGGAYNTVNAGGGYNVIFGGVGHDTFVLANAGQGFDAIAGFQLTNGDLLNVDAALRQAGWTGNLATLGNFLTVTDNSAGAALNILPCGSGAGVAIAELYGANNLTLASLVAHSLIT